MKIGPIESKLPAVNDAPAERRATGAQASSTAEPSAKVELSSAAALDSVEDASFDKAKVERIALAIREGHFEVNAGAIADKLIANAQEVLSRQRN